MDHSYKNWTILSRSKKIWSPLDFNFENGDLKTIPHWIGLTFHRATGLTGLEVKQFSEKAQTLPKDHLEHPLRPRWTTHIRTGPFWARQQKIWSPFDFNFENYDLKTIPHWIGLTFHRATETAVYFTSLTGIEVPNWTRGPKVLWKGPNTT